MTFLRGTALVLALAGATSVQAGGLDDPIVEPQIIVDNTTASSHDALVPIMALILFGAALAAN